jgi:hypothetical protein
MRANAAAHSESAALHTRKFLTERRTRFLLGDVSFFTQRSRHMTDCCNEKNAAQALGIVFLIAMLLGFTPNPLISPTGYFAVNPAHNMLHGLVGLALLSLANMGRGRMAILLFGAIYVLLGILGYWMKGQMMAGMVMVNMNDNYLHLILGVVMLGLGVWVRPAAKTKKA